MKETVKIVKDKSLSDGDLLYHYCGVATFFSIIKTRSIWLSDISKSNDSQELKWFLIELEAFIHRVWDSLILERKQEGYTDDPIEIQSLFSGIEQALKSESFKCWAFCLSEKRDDLCHIYQ